jgi:hypothetical protein
VSSAPAPKLDPIQSDVSKPDIPEPAITVETEENLEHSLAPAETSRQTEYLAIVHLTRTWVQYGIFGFAVLCIVIGAVEAMFGR